MIILKGFITLTYIHIDMLFSSGSKRKINGVNQDNNQIEVVKDLEPLTCDSMYFDKTKNIIYFRFNNNAEIYRLLTRHLNLKIT